MTDDEIEAFIRRWEGSPDIEECVDRRHYCVLTSNCIKFAYEFIAELTDGVFTVPHRCRFCLTCISALSTALLWHTTSRITAMLDTLLLDLGKVVEIP
jgi:hypothetical protein